MERERIFSIAEAAEYLGVKYETIKYYLYKAKTLKPDITLGGVNGFYQSTLDRFRATKRKPGRPPKSAE